MGSFENSQFACYFCCASIFCLLLRSLFFKFFLNFFSCILSAFRFLFLPRPEHIGQMELLLIKFYYRSQWCLLLLPARKWTRQEATVCVCVCLRIAVCVRGAGMGVEAAWFVYAEKGACEVCQATAKYLLRIGLVVACCECCKCCSCRWECARSHFGASLIICQLCKQQQHAASNNNSNSTG